MTLQLTKSGVKLPLEIWYSPEDKSIHMTSNMVPDMHMDVSGDPFRKNGNPAMFKRLAKLLRDHGQPGPSQEELEYAAA